jgi:hypothetical protein
MSDDPQFDYTYYEGFWSFRNEQVEVLMDEATFDTYLNAYLVSHGIDTRTYAELLAYVSTVDEQQHKAEKVLFNPDYWLHITDPNIRIIQVQRTQQPALTDEADERS